MRNQENPCMEQDMDRILDILRQVPQRELPLHFEAELKETLREEGRKIADKRSAGSDGINIKRFKIGFSLAACFVVGILSLSMYNNHGGFDSAESGLSSANTAEADWDRSGFGASDKALPAQTPQDGSEEASPPKLSLYRETAGQGSEEAALGLESPLLQSENPTLEADARYNMSSGSMGYLELIREYMDNAEYEILSQNTDGDTDRILFEIKIKSDKEGNPVNRFITLVGDGGKIYEQPQSEPTE